MNCLFISHYYLFLMSSLVVSSGCWPAKRLTGWEKGTIPLGISYKSPKYLQNRRTGRYSRHIKRTVSFNVLTRLKSNTFSASSITLWLSVPTCLVSACRVPSIQPFARVAFLSAQMAMVRIYSLFSVISPVATFKAAFPLSVHQMAALSIQSPLPADTMTGTPCTVMTENKEQMRINKNPLRVKNLEIPKRFRVFLGLNGLNVLNRYLRGSFSQLH